MIKDPELKKEYRQYMVPAVVSQVVFTTYTLVDAVFVARGVNESALAGVNIAAPFATALWALSMTFAGGTSAIASRLMGEDRLKEAREVFSRNMLLMTLVGILVTIAVLLGLGPFCELLGATDSTREYVQTYVRTIAPFSACFLASYTLEILTATDGFPTKATVISAIGVVTNVVLDYLLIIKWETGVWGAAFATGISQLLVIMIYLGHFLGKRSNIKFCRFKGLSPTLETLAKGVPTGASELSPGLITLIYVHAIQKYLNEDALVTFSAIAYVLIIIIVISIGIAQGSQPLISYYNGTGEIEKIDALMKYQYKSVSILMTASCLFAFLLAYPLVKIFISSDEALVAYSTTPMRIAIVSCLIVGFNVVLTSYFCSMEKPIQGVIISICRSAVMLIIGIYVSVLLFGPEGLWWGMTISEILTLGVAVLLYRKEKKDPGLF